MTTTPTDHEQNVQLLNHRTRLADLEDRIAVAFPTPETPVGGAQRIRFGVPTPSSVVTIGARGTAVSDGRAIGPGGIAMRTEEHLGVEIQGSTCINTVGLTLLHAVGSMGLLTHERLSLAATDGLALGTQQGPVEITAGGVSVPDPGYTVVPDADIPSTMPTVDVRSPRDNTEATEAAWNAIFVPLMMASYGRSMLRFWRAVTRGGSGPSVHSSVVHTITNVDAALSMSRHALEAALGAADAAEGAGDHVESSSNPGVRVHAHGDVRISAANKFEAFAVMGASLSTPNKASIKGGLRAGVYSAVSAKLYGAMMAKVKSDALVKISGPLVAISGDYAEIRGKQVVGLSSAQKVAIQSAHDVAIDAQTVAVSADAVRIAGVSRTMLLSQAETHVQSEHMSQMYVGDASSPRSEVKCLADEVLIRNEAGVKIELRRDFIRFNPGGSQNLIIERDHLEYGRFMVRRSETTIRGRILLG